MPNSAIDAAIATARTLLEHPTQGFYPDAFQLVSDSSGDDTAGGFTDTGDVVMASGFCKLSQIGYVASERIIADREGAQVPYRVTMPNTFTVNPAWRLNIAGRTFEIEDIKRAGLWDVQLTLLVREMT